MAKTSFVERNKKRRRLVAKYATKRARLQAIARDRSLAPEERFNARLKMAKLPRNSSKVRIRNLCELTGRSRGTYSKFKLSRIMLRDMAAFGQIPGLVKASW